MVEILNNFVGHLLQNDSCQYNSLNQMFLAFFNSSSIDSFFVLFIAILLLRPNTVLSKFVFATKFACFNLALKTSAAKVLNSGVVIYLSCLWLLSFFSIFVSLVL